MNDDSNKTKFLNFEQLKDSKRNQAIKISNPNLFSQDFIFFKNDVLRELKEINNKFENQKRLNMTIKDLISSQDIKLIEFNNKIEIVSNRLNDKKALAGYDNDKINELMNFKSKIEADFTSYDCKMKLNTEEIKNAINRYDKIICDNLVIPGIIGSNTRFKDLRDLIYFILNELKVFSAYKDKNSVDLKEYKTKLDSIVSSLNFQIRGIIGTANSFTTSNLKVVEKRYLEEIKAFDSKVEVAKEESKNLKRESITILGIFSSIMGVLVAGVGLSSAIFSNMDSVTNWLLCALTTLIVLFISNTLFRLFNFLREIADRQEKSSLILNLFNIALSLIAAYCLYKNFN